MRPCRSEVTCRVSISFPPLIPTYLHRRPGAVPRHRRGGRFPVNPGLMCRRGRRTYSAGMEVRGALARRLGTVNTLVVDAALALGLTAYHAHRALDAPRRGLDRRCLVDGWVRARPDAALALRRRYPFTVFAVIGNASILYDVLDIIRPGHGPVRRPALDLLGVRVRESAARVRGRGDPRRRPHRAERPARHRRRGLREPPHAVRADRRGVGHRAEYALPPARGPAPRGARAGDRARAARTRPHRGPRGTRPSGARDPRRSRTA